MKEILTLNKIAKCGTDRFDSAKYICTDNAEDPVAIMVRSASMHEMQTKAVLMSFLSSERVFWQSLARERV